MNKNNQISFNLQGLICQPIKDGEAYTLYKDESNILDLTAGTYSSPNLPFSLTNVWTTTNSYGTYELQYNGKTIVSGIQIEEWNPFKIEFSTVDTTNKKLIITATEEIVNTITTLP